MHEKILVTGTTTSIWSHLRPLVPSEVTPVLLSRDKCDLRDLAAIDNHKDLIATCNRIVLAHGILSPERFVDQNPSAILESLTINLLSFVRIVEIALDSNPAVRIVLLGSESGVKGSFDVSYALSKFSLHRYVEERKISHPGQQLVCVSPAIIADAGMTLQKADQNRVQKAMRDNPKGRGTTSAEVAGLIHSLLFSNSGYITNTVIHINGGKFARM